MKRRFSLNWPLCGTKSCFFSPAVATGSADAPSSLKLQLTLLALVTLAAGTPIGASKAAADPEPLAANASQNQPGELWSFKPIRSVPVPAHPGNSWIRNPIDAFILSKLQENKLLPAPIADRLALLRRVYFDLIGLPPSPAQIDAFINDK